jgi:hypothetical protein
MMVHLVREWRRDFGNWRKVVHIFDGSGRFQGISDSGQQKRSEGTDLEKPMSYMEVVDSIIMRRWIWLFVHGYECKSQISTAT